MQAHLQVTLQYSLPIAPVTKEIETVNQTSSTCSFIVVLHVQIRQYMYIAVIFMRQWRRPPTARNALLLICNEYSTHVWNHLKWVQKQDHHS